MVNSWHLCLVLVHRNPKIIWSGRWVMLENVHLAPGWLMQLEKKLHSMQPHACFRLFLTMEINPKVTPVTFKIGF